MFEVSTCCEVSGVHCMCATSCTRLEGWEELRLSHEAGRSSIDNCVSCQGSW